MFGAAFFLIGLFFWWRLCRRQPIASLRSANKRLVEYSNTLLKQLETQDGMIRRLCSRVEADAKVIASKQAAAPAAPVDALSQQVLLDAIARETRAKETLRRLLRDNGFAKEQIDAVMNAVDDTQPGDWDAADDL